MKLGLIPKLIIAVVVGILIGVYGPEPLIRLTETVRVFLRGLILFTVPLIIGLFIAAAIADLGKEGGKLLGVTVALSYVSTIIACVLAAIVAYAVVPAFAPPVLKGAEAAVIGGPFVVIEMPPVMGMISALVLAFIIGLGITWTDASTLKAVVDQGRDIMARVVRNMILPILPWFIGSVFVAVAAKGELFATAAIFARMLVLIVALQVIWLLILYFIAGSYSKQNPFVVMKHMIPAYLTAMGTMSSAATMPVSLDCGRRVPFLRREVVDFVMPLCSTTHLSGAAMTITMSAITVSLVVTGTLPPIGTMITFILLLGIIEVGAVGVPGGSLMAALAILTSVLGFGDVALGLMMALFMIQDSFGTATNIFGDGALAMIVNKVFVDDSAEATHSG